MDRRRFCTTVLTAAGLSLCGFGPFGAGAAGSLPSAELQAILDRAVADDGLPGVVLGVATPRGTFVGAAGKADLDTGRPLTPDDQIRLASVTKNLTAALILRLCDEGLVSLTETIGSHFPDCVPNAGVITVAQLLNHTAGVFDHEEDPALDILSPSGFAKDWTAEEILAFTWKPEHIPAATPGAQWSYSNTGYYLLGMLAEKVTGQTFEAAINQRFFTPLGLTRLAVTRQGALAAPCSGGYCLYPDGVTFRSMLGWNMSWDWTAGSGVATAADMLAWGQALFGGRLLRPGTLAAMTTPVGPAAHITADVGYGFGTEVWSRDEFFGEPCWSHGGGNGGTRTFLLHYPRARRTIFTGANRMDYAPPPAGVDATALLKNVLKAVAPLVDFPAPNAVPAAVPLLLSS